MKGNNQFINSWTNKEKGILRDNYKTKSNIEISVIIPLRTPQAISTKLQSMGLRRTKEERAIFLKGERHPMYGKQHSKKTKEKMSYVKKEMFKSGRLVSYWKGKKNPYLSKWNKKHNKDRIGKSYVELYGETTSNRIKKLSSERMKNNNPTKNGMSKEWKKKIGKATKKLWENPEHKKLMKLVLKKMQRLSKTKEALNKVRIKTKNQWKNKDSRDKLLNGLEWRPNKPETIMLNIIKENKLPFNYVGDGNFWISGNGHNFNPDFVDKEKKLIIEVFGDYWHNLQKNIDRDKIRLKTYKERNYSTLIIWEHELKNPNQVLNKIMELR